MNKLKFLLPLLLLVLAACNDSKKESYTLDVQFTDGKTQRVTLTGSFKEPTINAQGCIVYNQRLTEYCNVSNFVIVPQD